MITADTITDEQICAAEQIAQFLMDEAHACDHLEAVSLKLVEMATRIRQAEWTAK